MVDGILIGPMALCVVYFVVIVVHAGIGTSLAFVWLFFAALLLFLVYGKWYYVRNLDRVPGWMLVSVATTRMAGTATLAMLCVLVFLGTVTSVKSNLDYVIVLGARVKERAVNNSLQKCLDKTMEYTEGNPGMTLVLSEDRGPGKSVSEAEVIYQYLVYNGVKPEQLLIEDHPENTAGNIVHSEVVIEQHRKKNQKVLVSLR